jgi:hypothetical protein
MKSRKGKGAATSQEGRLSSHLEGTLKKIGNLQSMQKKPGMEGVNFSGKISRLAVQACQLTLKIAPHER